MPDPDRIATIELALKTLGCSQKELAVRLGVSPTQITKWKNGEYMSSEMRAKFREITNIGDMEPFVVEWAGSLKAAEQWTRLLRSLADAANDSADTGYSTYPLENNGDLDMLAWSTVHTLTNMGVVPPKTFSEDLNRVLSCLENTENYSEMEYEVAWTTIRENRYTALIYDIYKALTDVYGFYVAYVQELIDDDDLNLIDTDAANIEPCLMDLAATKINTAFASNLTFRHKTKKEYESWLMLVKNAAIKARAPLRAELMDLIYKTNDSLGAEAESESLGFNETRLHPDIYMNELLVGMRTIHQVLPAIMKKLGIYRSFKLDEREFRIDTADEG